MTEKELSVRYFERPHTVWFPDLEEEMERMERRYRKSDFHAMLALLSYFRREITGQQLLRQVFSEEAPKKLLPSDLKKYTRIKELCGSCRQEEISGPALDEQLLLCFRGRPTEDVFAPAYEAWEGIKGLISRLEQKMKALPVYFDGLGWGSYLKGTVTGREYAGHNLSWDPGGYLAQILVYGTDAEAIGEAYRREISVCVSLRKLCLDYKAELLSPEEFAAGFLALAEEFCWDTAK